MCGAECNTCQHPTAQCDLCVAPNVIHVSTQRLSAIYVWRRLLYVFAPTAYCALCVAPTVKHVSTRRLTAIYVWRRAKCYSCSTCGSVLSMCGAECYTCQHLRLTALYCGAECNSCQHPTAHCDLCVAPTVIHVSTRRLSVIYVWRRM